MLGYISSGRLIKYLGGWHLVQSIVAGGSVWCMVYGVKMYVDGLHTYIVVCIGRGRWLYVRGMAFGSRRSVV